MGQPPDRSLSPASTGQALKESEMGQEVTEAASLGSEEKRPISDNGKEKAEAVASAPYTMEEDEWMERHWKEESNFLATHGLSINNEENRDEGSRILRAMMEADKDGNDSDGDDYFECGETAVKNYAASFIFNDEELWFVDRNWGSPVYFMKCHHLDVYDIKDCEKAKAIVRSLIKEDDSDSDGGEGSNELIQAWF